MLIRVINATAGNHAKNVLNNISIDIKRGFHYAIAGPSGSGKTTLLHMLAGRCSHNGVVAIAPDVIIALVEQQHRFKNLSNTSSFYYQQRYNSMDADDALSVEQYLEEECNCSMDTAHAQGILERLQVDKLLGRRLIQLSNGENKRVQLAKALLLQPQVLLLDNAFVGLDNEARTMLTNLLESIASEGVSVVLVTSATYIPRFVDTVLQLTNDGRLNAMSRQAFLQKRTVATNLSLDIEKLRALTSEEQNVSFEYAIQMNEVSVTYSGKQVVQQVSWKVKKGERWALSGPNGAGKSTLLSLINADNPQAYANEIYLFDKKRGSGESIWDIKKKIGYVSPELHLYFERSCTAFEVVASGLFDTIGLFRKLNEEQDNKINDWMKLLNIHDAGRQLFSNLSSGLQRLVLLCRALVKNPPLLLLDEPAQGLDDEQSALFRHVVEQICAHSDKTLVYISHYREEIPSCVSKHIELKDGKANIITE